jgi:hypothetical protein
MGIGAYKYLVKGAFEGTFTTLQEEPLTTSSIIPAGDEHKITIHRGIISHSTQITEEEYQHALSSLYFNEVQNIEIQRSPYWPLTNDAIFSLHGMKLADVEVSQVTRMNDKTIATLKGTVFSKVSQMDFDVSVGTRDEPDENRYVKNQWNDKKWSKNGGCNRGLGNSIQNSLSGCSPGGCNTPSGCLKWLLYLLLLLLLLGLLGQCTQFGRTLHCYYDAWKEKKEILKLQEKKDKLIEKIEKTKKETTPCGKISDPNGKNTPKSYTFDLGQKSGTLRLRYEMYEIPDRIEVIYDGKLVALTNDQRFNPITVNRKKYNLDYLVPMGYAQGSGELKFDYHYNKNKPTELLVRVIPSREFETTEWTIDIFCP